MTETPVHIGVVGLGFMAAMHLRAYQNIPGAKIVAVCNPSGRNLDGDLSNVAGNIGGAQPLKLDMTQVKGCRQPEELFQDPRIDVIDICTPTRTHRDLCLGALAAGKHVICEKPLARNSQVASEILRGAQQAKGFFMPAMCLRFWPEFVWLKKAIESGAYGKVKDARFRRVAEPPAWGRSNYFEGRESGGALLDLHIHDVDFIQYAFGAPKKVFARGYSRHSGAIDHVVAHYFFDAPCVVHAEGSWAMTEGFGFHMSFTVNFEKATADFDLARAADGIRLFEPGKEVQNIRCEAPDGYVGELAYFLNCVRTKTAPEVVTIHDACRAIKICEAEEASIASGQIVACRG